jgi:glycerol-3-phosphate dehydrogenase
MNAMSGLENFNRAARPELFKRLATESWDLLIIGGGITGASIFRDATLRGMRAALLEARDFSSGTSSRSSKLIHGGLRYLKNLGFLMAWESCHERNLHVQLNKRLVRPMPFLVPLYNNGGESRAMLQLGMWLYEFTSGFANHEFHRFIQREETLNMAPGLPSDGLIGGCIYYDAIVSDNRWTIEIIKDGVRNGGLALNYAPVSALLKENGKLTGVAIEDKLSNSRFEAKGRAVVNATGIFADSIRRMDQSDAPRMIRLSKGTHMIFAEEDVPLNVTTVFNSKIDDRPLFLVKRDGCFLFGTSDDWSEAEPSAPVPEAKDCNYLLQSLQGFMPEAGLTREKVRFVYSGFRPLLCKPGEEIDPTKASREDSIDVSPSGLISIAGGKLTTARLMAERVLKLVMSRLGRDSQWKASQTHLLSIGGTNAAVAESLAQWVKRGPQLAGYFRILFERYGLDANNICEEALRIHNKQHPDSRAEPIRAEVQYVCRHEMVCTLEDLFDRRAGFLYWSPEKRLERLRHGAHVIREELGQGEKEFEEQFEAYRQHLRRFHTVPECQ